MSNFKSNDVIKVSRSGLGLEHKSHGLLFGPVDLSRYWFVLGIGLGHPGHRWSWSCLGHGGLACSTVTNAKNHSGCFNSISLVCACNL